MYQGALNRGAQLMLLFFASIAMTSFGILEFAFIAALPVIYCYSFFESVNCLFKEEQAKDGDLRIFEAAERIFVKNKGNKKVQKYVGIGLILLGVWVMIERFAFPVIEGLLSRFFYVDLWYYGAFIRNIFVAVLIIVCGVIILKKSGMIEEAADEPEETPVVKLLPESRENEEK